MIASASDQSVPLRQWAKDNGVPYRTALAWAKGKKIPAKIQTGVYTVTVTRKVRRYYISSSVKPFGW